MGESKSHTRGSRAQLFTRMLGGHPSGIIQGQKAQVAAFSGHSGSGSQFSHVLTPQIFQGTFSVLGKPCGTGIQMNEN